MDGLLTQKDSLLKLIDELRSRGAVGVAIGDFSVTFAAPLPSAAPGDHEPPRVSEVPPTPEELEALLYQETLKL